MAPSTADLMSSLEDATDITSWINATLVIPSTNGTPASKDVIDLAELDQQITNLLATFEIASQDTSSQLERIIDDVSRGVPRLTYDLHFMRDGAQSLQGDLSKLQTQAKDALPGPTCSALDRIQYLDNVKTQMEAAREVLREAESWSTLESEVTSLLGDKSYEKAAERLNEANRSMIVFQNTSEFESRRTLMISLQNQLEAALSSALVAAINSQDVVVCRNYFSIFCNIQRESEFRNYYNGSRRTPLATLWQNANLSDCDSSPSSESLPQTLNSFLAVFYSNFLNVLNAERTSIPSIFPNPQLTFSTLITSVLSGLQPAFSQRLASLFSHSGASALREIIIAFRATEEFAASVDKMMEKISLSEVPLLPMSGEVANSSDGLQPSKLHRRRSTRMSMSFRANSHNSVISPVSAPPALVDAFDWDQMLFQPFLDFQADYGTLERRLLDEELHGIIGASAKVTETERARLLRERSVDVFAAAEESLGRCLSFTHGYGAVGLVQALDHFFKAFVETWTTEAKYSPLSSTMAVSESDEDLADLDYSPQDWSDIQASLRLLTSARAILERLTGFETKLRSTLTQIASAFRLARSNNNGIYIPGTTRGEGLLLSQSSLNSADLHELLQNIENDGTSRVTRLSDPQPLLLNARSAIAAFAKSCQSSLQKTILSPLFRDLTSYASTSMWSVQTDSQTKRIGTRGVSDLQVPTFSLSPSDVMQHVAEGLLNLPRLFEVYVDDDALSFSLETLPYIDDEFLKALTEQSRAGSEATSPNARRGSLSSSMKPSALSPEAISSAWLSSLGHLILSHLTSDILPNIRTLSIAGAAQLASDLGYLSNIVRALNVEHTALEKWKEYVGMNEDDGKSAMAEKLLGDQVFSQVAKMKGWT